MIAGVNLRLPEEYNSMMWPDSRPLTDQIWDTAARLKVKEFLPHTTPGPILDDHVMLHDLGRIPACDIICDFGPAPVIRNGTRSRTIRSTARRCR